MRLDGDPSDFEPAPRPVPKGAGLAFIQRRLRRERQRTRDASRYGVDLNFGNYRILLSGREIGTQLAHFYRPFCTRHPRYNRLSVVCQVCAPCVPLNENCEATRNWSYGAK
jgi:hypothetical protein